MKEPEIRNRLELLEEIRNNNCREIISCEVNLRVGEITKIKIPQQMEQINNFLQVQKKRREDLLLGLWVIDDEIAKITKK